MSLRRKTSQAGHLPTRLQQCRSSIMVKAIPKDDGAQVSRTAMLLPSVMINITGPLYLLGVIFSKDWGAPVPCDKLVLVSRT